MSKCKSCRELLNEENFVELIVHNVRVTRNSAKKEEWLYPDERLFLLCGYCTNKIADSLIHNKVEYTINS